jgi:hypothetical protein
MDRTTYKNQHIKEHYDRINLIVPKGQKDNIKRIAEEMGMSVNEYICTLIFKDTATGHSLMQVHKGLTEEQIEQLDRWQVAAKYRQMIESFSGSMTEGYVIRLKKGFINDVSGSNMIVVRTTKEIRQVIVKSHAIKEAGN